MSKKSTIGVFDDEEKVIGAIRKLKNQNVKIHDVYGPFASHEILTAVTRPSRLPHLAFIYGAFAIIGTFAFLYYTSVIDYPLSYGGKPIFSFPPMVVVIYLLTILISATLSVFTFLGRQGMYPGKKVRMPADGAMDDRFILVIEESSVERSTLETILKENGAIEIRHE